MKMSTEDIVALIRDKGGLGLARPLMDMGVTVDAFKITGDEGRRGDVRACFASHLVQLPSCT